MVEHKLEKVASGYRYKGVLIMKMKNRGYAWRVGYLNGRNSLGFPTLQDARAYIDGVL